MQHVYKLSDAQLSRPSIVTVGMFDGVHRGHQALIGRLVEAAYTSDRAAVVLTFFPHPDVVLKDIQGRYYLTTPEERARLLGDLGVDLVVTHPFDQSVRQMRAIAFVERLQTHLKLSELWATSNFALGYKREGNMDFLRAQGLEKGFAVKTVQLVADEDTHDVIASSRIRQALIDGDVVTAAYLLGRLYQVEGRIVPGDKRGRQIGIPTANIDVWPYQILPDNGVYACYAILEGETRPAVTNIGIRPTFDGQVRTVETHLLDFDGDIYEKNLRLAFVERLRGEMKFNAIEALIEQIRQDIAVARQILERG
jgi:riboflavin kinase/FMN adenylyltransferase